jgi:competence protein ComEA
MIKKLMFAIAALVATMSLAFAQVDVNKADAAALDGIKGVGPSMSKAILAERTKGGDFKDWADFESRVKGVKEKKAIQFSKAGLQVNGKSKEGGEMVAEQPKAEKSAKTKETPAAKPAKM